MKSYMRYNCIEWTIAVE